MSLKYSACHTFRAPRVIYRIPFRHPISPDLRRSFASLLPNPPPFRDYRNHNVPRLRALPVIQLWTPRCPVGCAWGPQDHQNGAPGYPTAPPRDVKMEPPGLPNHCFANPTSHQLTGHQGASCTSRLFRKCGNVCFPRVFLHDGQHNFGNSIA